MHYYLGISSALAGDIAHSFALIREDGETLYVSMKDYFEQKDVYGDSDPQAYKSLRLENVADEGVRIPTKTVRHSVILRQNIQRRITAFFKDDHAITIHSRLLEDFMAFSRVSKYGYDFCLTGVPITYLSHPQIFNSPEGEEAGVVSTQEKYRLPARNAYWRARMLMKALTDN